MADVVLHDELPSYTFGIVSEYFLVFDGWRVGDLYTVTSKILDLREGIVCTDFRGETEVISVIQANKFIKIFPKMSPVSSGSTSPFRSSGTLTFVKFFVSWMFTSTFSSGTS
jgi:hypothetical protein